MTKWLATLLLASTTSTLAVDGSEWVRKAEAQLYRWPDAPGRITFEVHTDVLAGGIAAMERDLARKPDAEGTRVLTALKDARIRGSIDTKDGAVSVDVGIDCETLDRRAQVMLAQVKSIVNTQVRGALEGLSLRDPSLVPKGAAIGAAREDGDAIRVELVRDKDAQPSELVIDRHSALPVALTLPTMSMRYTYASLGRGTYVPESVTVEPKSGQPSSARYTWQNVGERVFPDDVVLTQGKRNSRVSFHELRFEPAQ